MPTTREIAAEINRRWSELSRDGALNREETVAQIIAQMLNQSCICIYCKTAFNLNTPEGKEAITKHVMSCDKNPMVAVYLEAKKFLDSNLRTEHNDTDKSDAEVLAEISDITLDIKPDVDSDSAGTITERVKAAVEMAKQLESSKRIMNAQELRLRELGDDPSEAVAVIGEPVHPAFKERDELAGLVKHIWIHSAYKQNGYIQMTTEQKKVYCGVIGAEFDPLEPKFRDVEKCKCRRCLTERGAIKAGSTSGYDLTTMQAGTEFVGMIVCEHCGNKRCPHATDHRHACADSNEPGQAGSIFEGVGAVSQIAFAPPKFSMKELRETMENLLTDAHIQHAEFQNKQLADAIIQALQCGDFTRLIVQGTPKESVVYIPYQREQELISKHNAITEMVSRFLIAHRDTHRCWLDSFVEVGAVTIDWNANPYGEVKPVKL